MNPLCRPQNLHDALVRLVEECTEVGKECCKGLRFGVHDHDPKDPTKTPNFDRIRREMEDLVGAYEDVCKFVRNERADAIWRDPNVHTHVYVDGYCVNCGLGWANDDGKPA